MSEFGIGYTYIQELKKQHHNLERFRSAFEEKRSILEEKDAYSYDRLIEFSSDAKGNVGSKIDNLRPKLIWCINHYLGLNRHPRVIKATQQAIEIYGTGSGTSSVSGGRSKLHLKIEEFLKSFLHKEDIVLFPTGYTTNLGMLSTIVQKNDLIISDSENHASIINGIKMSGATKTLFKHNSIKDLEEKLAEAKGKYTNIFVVLESVYSMSGDLTPLQEIVALKEKYNFFIYLDEAHSFGFYGANGRGLASELGVLDKIDFFISTFSKSCASIGGFCAFNNRFRTMISLRAPSYLFQATFPPSAAATIYETLKIFSTDSSFAESLHQKNNYMRTKLIAAGFDLGNSASPIIPIFIREVKTLTEFESELYELGIFSVSVLYPVVKPDEGRIRLIVNNSHTFKDIDETVEILTYLGLKHKIIQNGSLIKNKNLEYHE